MPTIAGPNSSPYKEVMAVRSERIAGADSNSSPLKRKLRSDSAAVQGNPICTPMKWKSPRRFAASSPKTPENAVTDDLSGRVTIPSKSVVKKLYDGINDKSNWNPRDNEHMRAVKEALHVSIAPSTVVCRENEQVRILDFVKACVEEQKPGSLYICGCPGTGKSLSMEKVKQQLIDWTEEEDFQTPDVISMNCTSLTNTSEIFSKILDQPHHCKKANGSTPLQHLQKLYSKKQSSGSKMMLIVADELDYLITRGRGVLHDLFMLTTLPFSRCILIGIANAIDLADRFLPKLKSLNCRPEVITFRAYSKDQILRILQERLMALPYAVFQQQALELCARKVAAASGDMRKALCICRSALEMLETELRDSIVGSDSHQEGELLKQHPPTEDNLIVRIDHMASALAKTFKSPVVDTIQSIPQHQQIVLCSAVKAFRWRKKDTTVGELNKFYMEVCKISMIPPAGNAEFTNMCKVLSDQGLLKLGPGRDDKLKRVTLKIDESDITFALQGIRFFRNCLQ